MISVRGGSMHTSLRYGLGLGKGLNTESVEQLAQRNSLDSSNRSVNYTNLRDTSSNCEIFRNYTESSSHYFRGSLDCPTKVKPSAPRKFSGSTTTISSKIPAFGSCSIVRILYRSTLPLQIGNSKTMAYKNSCSFLWEKYSFQQLHFHSREL